jgi:hypothetical protein
MRTQKKVALEINKCLYKARNEFNINFSFYSPSAELYTFCQQVKKKKKKKYKTKAELFIIVTIKKSNQWKLFKESVSLFYKKSRKIKCSIEMSCLF